MSMVLLTILGLIIAGMLTGAFPAIGSAIRRRQQGHAVVPRRAAPWRPGPRVQAAGPGHKSPGIKPSGHAPSGFRTSGFKMTGSRTSGFSGHGARATRPTSRTGAWRSR
jgi:hypothetical protein